MHGIDHSVPLFFTRVRGTRIPVTPQLVADVLQVPRIEFPDYPGCECLRNVSRDELMSAFCDVPVTCPLVLIQEFYSNMHGIDRLVPLFFTRV